MQEAKPLDNLLDALHHQVPEGFLIENANSIAFPNKRLQVYFQLYDQLMPFSDVCWWLIDLEVDPSSFYCNKNMSSMFNLDGSKIKHSISQFCPIAGDYNNNVAIKCSKQARKIFDDYYHLQSGAINEYNNRFPYYDSSSNETLYFSSRAVSLTKDSSGKALLLFGLIKPEIIGKDLYSQIKQDWLTGINNRREFDFQLKQLLNLAYREESLLSLVLCDIDYFKQYNDNLGHFAGDQCLVAVAGAISAQCQRGSDIVCRYGGEEFAILIYGSDDRRVNTFLESIRQSVCDLSLPHPRSAEKIVTISVGAYCVTPDSSMSVKDIIERADQALYQAKQGGRNRCVISKPD